MAPQRLEKIESGPGNRMGSGASNPQDVVHARLTARDSGRGVSIAVIAVREADGKIWSRPEMAPQRLERIESAPGNGMGSDASNHKMWYTGARLTARESD
jgi:hypothetical protein